jgi:hypothetical protein
MTTLRVPPPRVIPVHPDGKTCSTCIHFERCKWLLSYSGDETSCDWIPSRYVPKQDKAAREGGE